MPEFFIPHIDDADYAETVWQSTKEFAEETHGWKNVRDARVFRLGYVHDGKHMEAEVGVSHPYGFETSWERPGPPKEREWVVVILECEGGPFLVCTESRGVLRGEPILVGRGEPYEVVYFDGYGPE